MTLQKLSEREERIEREYKRWEEEFEIPFMQEFTVRSLLDLQDQFKHASAEHTKTRMDLLLMINKLQSNLSLKRKEKSEAKLSHSTDSK